MPRGIYERTEYHMEIAKKNDAVFGFKKGVSSFNKGIKMSDVTRQKLSQIMKNSEMIKISISNLPKDVRKEKNPFWKGGKPNCIDCGKKLAKYGAKRCKEHAEAQLEKREKLLASIRGVPAWNSGKKYPQISGKNHWNWQDGKTSENHKIRTSTEYKKLLRERLGFDDFTCRDCGERGGRLEVNHIKPFSIYPEFRLASDNLETLCKDCHRIKTRAFLLGNKYANIK